MSVRKVSAVSAAATAALVVKSVIFVKSATAVVVMAVARTPPVRVAVVVVFEIASSSSSSSSPLSSSFPARRRDVNANRTSTNVETFHNLDGSSHFSGIGKGDVSESAGTRRLASVHDDSCRRDVKSLARERLSKRLVVDGP